MTSILALFRNDLSLRDLAVFLDYVVGGGLIFYLLWWMIGYFKLPEPANKVARGLLVLIGVIALIFLIVAVVERLTGSV